MRRRLDRFGDRRGRWLRLSDAAPSRLLPGTPSSIFYSSKTSRRHAMSCAVTLRRTGGAITLSIPKSIARALAVDAGTVMELEVEGRTLSVTPARRGLADRLAASPKSPARWGRDGLSPPGGRVRPGVFGVAA